MHSENVSIWDDISVGLLGDSFRLFRIKFKIPEAFAFTMSVVVGCVWYCVYLWISDVTIISGDGVLSWSLWDRLMKKRTSLVHSDNCQCGRPCLHPSCQPWSVPVLMGVQFSLLCFFSRSSVGPSLHTRRSSPGQAASRVRGTVWLWGPARLRRDRWFCFNITQTWGVHSCPLALGLSLTFYVMVARKWMLISSFHFFEWLSASS